MLRESGISREELFITTKLWVQDAGYEDAKRAMDIGCSEIINHYSECTAKALNQTKIHD